MALPERVSRQTPAQAMATEVLSLIKRALEDQMANASEQLANHDKRIKDLEDKAKRDALTRSQARTVQKAVARKVYDVLARIDGTTKAQHFSNVHSAIWDKFDCPSYLEIPRNRFEEAVTFISGYDGSGKNWWID